jgi:ketosteroid isomerase-like protein
MNIDAITAIKRFLKDTNKAWSSGKPENLNHYFHDHIIIVSPDLKIMGSGKEPCIQSYIDFLSRPSDIHFHADDPDVFVFDNTAVAFYTYHISWKMEGRQSRETGKEIYVLNKQKDEWLIVMRKINPAADS